MFPIASAGRTLTRLFRIPIAGDWHGIFSYALGIALKLRATVQSIGANRRLSGFAHLADIALESDLCP